MTPIVFVILVLCFGGVEAHSASQRHHHTGHHHYPASLLASGSHLKAARRMARGANSTANEDRDEEDDEEDDDSAEDTDTPEATAPPAHTKLAVQAARPAPPPSGGEERLEWNLRRQSELRARISDLENEHAFEKKVDASVVLMSNETGTPSLAKMLGGMWKEMRMFAVPFYKEHLEDEVEDLRLRAKALQGEQLPPVQPKAKKAPEVEKPKRAKAEAEPEKPEDPSEPMFTKDTMPKVSPAVQGIISLTAQYFIIYSIAAILATAQTYAPKLQKYQKLFESATATVTYAPMLAVLFAATRIRAVQLSLGDTEKHQLPQPWAQTAMYCCTYAVLGQVLMVLLIPFLTGGTTAELEDDGQMKTPAGLSPILAKIVTVVRYLLMAMLYIGMDVICYGLVTMQGPPQTANLPVSPAVKCTMILAGVYFAVYTGVAILRTVQDLSPRLRSNSRVLQLTELFSNARACVNLAPMIAVLFLGARVRALQIDPVGGNPQKWAQRTFYVCTMAVVFNAVLMITLPLIDKGAKVMMNPKNGTVILVMANKTLQSVMIGLTCALLLCLQIGVLVVVVSVFLIEHPGGQAMTPPVAPALLCMMELTFWYFLMHTGCFVCGCINDQILPAFGRPGKVGVDHVFSVFAAGVEKVMRAPMLSILFLAARIRANQLTRLVDNTIPTSAGPQPWAQQAMFVATWAVIIMVVSACLVAVINLTAKGSSMNTVFNVVIHFSELVMYAAACTVVYAIFTMTPETLPPQYNKGAATQIPKPVSPVDSAVDLGKFLF